MSQKTQPGSFPIERKSPIHTIKTTLKHFLKSFHCFFFLFWFCKSFFVIFFLLFICLSICFLSFVILLGPCFFFRIALSFCYVVFFQFVFVLFGRASVFISLLYCSDCGVIFTGSFRGTDFNTFQRDSWLFRIWGTCKSLVIIVCLGYQHKLKASGLTAFFHGN